jgi:riboflavin kinase, archaea type
MIRIEGKVVSGRANFGQWIERLSSFYEKKTGVRLYPGTLNIELSAPYSLPLDVIRLEAHEYGGSVSVSIVPCKIFDRRAFLLRTDQNERGTGHHPRNIIEIATDIHLRDAYQLKDGDWVEVQFPYAPCTTLLAAQQPDPPARRAGQE